MPLVVAAVILVVGAGAAAAIVLGNQSDSPGTTVTTSTEAAGATSQTGEESIATSESEGESEAESEVEEAGFPAVGRSQMAAEIQPLLLSYHQDLVDGDFQGAWSLLSPRKRQQDLREYGYRKWMRAQASLSPYLSPEGLTARIDSLEDEGVALVMVTGMGWSAPDSPCSQWSGLTWVKYEGGEWTYDPGYSTTPSRRRAWRSRSGELLGAGC